MKKNIVFMTAVKVPGKESRSAPYKFGIDSFKKWCDKRNYQLVVLEDPIFDHSVMKPNFYRYFCFDLLENQGIEYDKILLTDADAIIHPDCPDFFELSDEKLSVTHTDGSYDWTVRSMENYAHEIFGGKTFNLWKYFNAGFIVLNKSHKDLLKSFTNFYLENQEKIRFIQEKYKTGTDQPLINHFVHNVFNLPVNIMPYRFCMADLSSKNLLTEELLYTRINGIYQFNAIPNNINDKLTYYWMEKTYKFLYEI
jgi:hypothetical protein